METLAENLQRVSTGQGRRGPPAHFFSVDPPGDARSKPGPDLGMFEHRDEAPAALQVLVRGDLARVEYWRGGHALRKKRAGRFLLRTLTGPFGNRSVKVVFGRLPSRCRGEPPIGSPIGAVERSAEPGPLIVRQD